MNTFDLDVIKTIAIITNLLLTIVVLLYTNFKEKDKATKSSIDSVEEHLGAKIENVSLRLARVETDVSHDDIVRIHARIDDVAKTISDTNLMIGNLSGQLGNRRHWWTW